MPVDVKTLKPVKPKVKYLVKHEGPNRALRRRIAAKRHIANKRFWTWWRELERKGIDPKRVLLARKLREAVKIAPVAGEEQASNG